MQAWARRDRHGVRPVSEIGQARGEDSRRGARDGAHHTGAQEYDGIDGPGIYHQGELDEKEMVADGEAFEATRLLAQREGLFVGTSAGAAVAVALKRALTMDRGTIVVLLPDRGDRYLSTMQFRSVCAKCPP